MRLVSGMGINLAEFKMTPLDSGHRYMKKPRIVFSISEPFSQGTDRIRNAYLCEW